MRIIARKNLEAYGAKNPGALAALNRWLVVAKAAEWRTTAEVVATFSKAKVVTKERVRFEIAGGDCRLIVAFDFTRQIAFIKFVGSHAEYDRVDAATVSVF